jgi:branched-chain amino acid transport system permease protein
VFGNLIEAGQLENLQKILFGSLIIYLLIKEPAGLTALFGTLRRKLAFLLPRASKPAHSSDQ